MKTIRDILRGVVIGVANIIPGVSGSTIAIIFGLYVGSVVLTRYESQTSAQVFANKLESLGDKVYHHYSIPGYPYNIEGIVSEKGYGKKTPVEEYRVTGRGGLGVRNYMVTEKTGPVIGIKVVDSSEDLLLVTQAGILIRTHVENIRSAGRATQGVIVMRFKEEGDRIISIALLPATIPQTIVMM